jgi:hypothetical protein
MRVGWTPATLIGSPNWPLGYRERRSGSRTSLRSTLYWFDECEHPTVRKVVEHFQLLQGVDPAYPVILGPDNRVMDGMHRIARALLEGKTTIRALRLRELPEPDYRRCRPDQLPYDR